MTPPRAFSICGYIYSCGVCCSRTIKSICHSQAHLPRDGPGLGTKATKKSAKTSPPPSPIKPSTRDRIPPASPHRGRKSLAQPQPPDSTSCDDSDFQPVHRSARRSSVRALSRSANKSPNEPPSKRELGAPGKTRDKEETSQAEDEMQEEDWGVAAGRSDRPVKGLAGSKRSLQDMMTAEHASGDDSRNSLQDVPDPGRVLGPIPKRPRSVGLQRRALAARPMPNEASLARQEVRSRQPSAKGRQYTHDRELELSGSDEEPASDLASEAAGQALRPAQPAPEASDAPNDSQQADQAGHQLSAPMQTRKWSWGGKRTKGVTKASMEEAHLSPDKKGHERPSPIAENQARGGHASLARLQRDEEGAIPEQASDSEPLQMLTARKRPCVLLSLFETTTTDAEQATPGEHRQASGGGDAAESGSERMQHARGRGRGRGRAQCRSVSTRATRSSFVLESSSPSGLGTEEGGRVAGQGRAGSSGRSRGRPRGRGGRSRLSTMSGPDTTQPTSSPSSQKRAGRVAVLAGDKAPGGGKPSSESSAGMHANPHASDSPSGVDPGSPPARSGVTPGSARDKTPAQRRASSAASPTSADKPAWQRPMTRQAAQLHEDTKPSSESSGGVHNPRPAGSGAPGRALPGRPCGSSPSRGRAKSATSPTSGGTPAWQRRMTRGVAREHENTKPGRASVVEPPAADSIDSAQSRQSSMDCGPHPPDAPCPEQRNGASTDAAQHAKRASMGHDDACPGDSVPLPPQRDINGPQAAQHPERSSMDHDAACPGASVPLPPQRDIDGPQAAQHAERSLMDHGDACPGDSMSLPAQYAEMYPTDHDAACPGASVPLPAQHDVEWSQAATQPDFPASSGHPRLCISTSACPNGPPGASTDAVLDPAVPMPGTDAALESMDSAVPISAALKRMEAMAVISPRIADISPGTAPSAPFGSCPEAGPADCTQSAPQEPHAAAGMEPHTQLPAAALSAAAADDPSLVPNLAVAGSTECSQWSEADRVLQQRRALHQDMRQAETNAAAAARVGGNRGQQHGYISTHGPSASAAEMDPATAAYNHPGQQHGHISTHRPSASAAVMHPAAAACSNGDPGRQDGHISTHRPSTSAAEMHPAAAPCDNGDPGRRHGPGRTQSSFPSAIPSAAGMEQMRSWHQAAAAASSTGQQDGHVSTGTSCLPAVGMEPVSCCHQAMPGHASAGANVDAYPAAAPACAAMGPTRIDVQERGNPDGAVNGCPAPPAIPGSEQTATPMLPSQQGAIPPHPPSPLLFPVHTAIEDLQFTIQEQPSQTPVITSIVQNSCRAWGIIPMWQSL